MYVIGHLFTNMSKVPWKLFVTEQDCTKYRCAFSVFQVTSLTCRVAELEGLLDRGDRERNSLNTQLEEAFKKLTAQEADNSRVEKALTWNTIILDCLSTSGLVSALSCISHMESFWTREKVYISDCIVWAFFCFVFLSYVVWYEMLSERNCNGNKWTPDGSRAV